MKGSDNTFLDVEKRPPDQFDKVPLTTSTDGGDAHIKFDLCLHAKSDQEHEYFIDRGQIAVFLKLEKQTNRVRIKPLRSSNWRFYRNGKAVINIRLENLSKKKENGISWVSFGLIDKETAACIEVEEWSTPFPVSVVSKYPKPKAKQREISVVDDADLDEQSEDDGILATPLQYDEVLQDLTMTTRREPKRAKVENENETLFNGIDNSLFNLSPFESPSDFDFDQMFPRSEVEDVTSHLDFQNITYREDKKKW